MSVLRTLLDAIVHLVALRRWPVRRVLMKQVYFSGIQSMPLVLAVGIAVGGIVVSQLHYQIGQSGEATLRLLASITVTELAPLLTVLLMAARSSAAMASELALMRANGELAALERMGIDLYAYLVLPRILGMMLSAAVLTFYFGVAAIVAGAVGVAGFGWRHSLSMLPLSLPLSDLLLCAAKSLAFGAAVATVACARGLAASGSGTEVPIAASQAVIRGLMALFAIDLLFILVRHYL